MILPLPVNMSMIGSDSISSTSGWRGTWSIISDIAIQIMSLERVSDLSMLGIMIIGI